MSGQGGLEVLGTAAGLLVAVIVLIGLSVWLLSPEATSAKVLVAVWLWALPLAGVCAGLGWLIGRLAGRVIGAGR
jgi:cytochrome bd-type quinol oxidase subunit 1